MFWKFSYSASNIQTILEKPDVTLQEILDEDDVIQECKSNNEKLVTFLTQNENLNKLISYVTILPSQETDDRNRFKYSTISSELLTCDIPAIYDSIISNNEFIDKLYSFLYNDAPLNPLLASYFARVMGSLITRKTESLLTYLQSKNDFVQLILKNINTSAVMDVLLRLLTTIDNNDLKQRVLKWLTDIELIKNLISLFSHTYTNDVHSNVSQLLCDIIRICREQILAQRENQRDVASYNFGVNNSNDYSNSMDTNQQNQQLNDSSFNNQLLDTIETVEVIETLLDYMFDSINGENISLSFGIDVLLTILEPKTSTVEFIFESKNLEADRLFREQERYLIASRGIKNVSNACISRLKLLNELLINDKLHTIKKVTMTYGELTPPLGSMKLNIIKLIAKLIGTNNSKLNEEIVHFKIFNTIFDYIFTNKWNNFLHTQLLNILTTILNVSNQTTNISIDDLNENQNNNELLQNSATILFEHLLKDCNLIERLLTAWSTYYESSSYDQSTGKKSNNAGHIGHLTIISNLIANLGGNFSASLKNYFEQAPKEISEKWKEFEETKLTEINNRNTQDLVQNPLASCNSFDSNHDNEAIELPSDENMQRKFADFNKEMIPSFPDSFGSNEFNINNLFGKTPDGLSKLQNITFQSFQMEANEDNAAQLFDQICSQRDNMREAIGESDEDIWVSREIKFAETTNNEIKPKIESSNLSDDSSSSSSDEDDNFMKYRGTGHDSGSSKPKSQRINDADDLFKTDTNSDTNLKNNANNINNSNNDVQMELTNSNDFKSSNQSDENNWADFTQFNNQEIISQQQNESSSTNKNKQLNVKSNLSNDEDNSWANFDNFNELTDERCSSPNSSSTLMQTNTPVTINNNDSNDRSNAYLTNNTTNNNNNNNNKTENIEVNEQKNEEPIKTDDNLNKEQLSNLNNSDETPMDSTSSTDESQNLATKEKQKKCFQMNIKRSSASSVVPSAFIANKINSLFNSTTSTASVTVAAGVNTNKTVINSNSPIIITDKEQNELNNNFLFLSSKGLMRSSVFKNNSKK